MRSVLPVAIAVGASLFTSQAAAHFDASSPYTHSDCPGTTENRVDPINVVFTSWGTWGRAVSQIESHAGWTNTAGSSQTFLDHGGCNLMHAQRANGSGTRFHLRVRGQHSDFTLGFDQGRDELEARFAAAAHETCRLWWGNTQSFRQCDGDYAGSDGWTLFIELHQVNH